MERIIVRIAFVLMLYFQCSSGEHAQEEDELKVMMKTTIDNIAFLLDRIEGVNLKATAIQDAQKEMRQQLESYAKWTLGVDECLRDTFTCGANEKCIMEEGVYKCQCQEGYEKTTPVCKDINECQLGIHECQPPLTCANEDGGHRCQCLPPFRENGTSCELECSHPSLYLEDLGCITPILFRLNWEKAQTQCERMNMRLLEGVGKTHLQTISDHFLPLMVDRPFPWIGFRNKTWISTNETILKAELMDELEDELEGDCGSCDMRLSGRRLYDYPCSDTEYSLCQIKPSLPSQGGWRGLTPGS